MARILWRYTAGSTIKFQYRHDKLRSSDSEYDALLVSFHRQSGLHFVPSLKCWEAHGEIRV